MKHDTSYLHNAIDSELVKASVDNLVALIRLSKVEFDTIVFRGMSGALIAPTVAYLLGKEIIMIRKKDDDSHTSRRVEGYTQLQNFIIIDDFISSGETMREIFKALWNTAANYDHWQGIYRAQCAGIFLHNSAVWRGLDKHPYTIQWDDTVPARKVNVWQAYVERNNAGDIRMEHTLPEIAKQRLTIPAEALI